MTGRPSSVVLGRDGEVLSRLLAVHARDAQLLIDVTANRRRMWSEVDWPGRRIFMDIDPGVAPDVVGDFRAMPFADRTADVIVFDPPHLPAAAGSAHSLAHMRSNYGLGGAPRGNDVVGYFAPFLLEARRVLRDDGVVFAKIKDYVHNHAYRWCSVAFVQAVQALEGLTACDLVVKVDPAGGNLKSGKWERAHHLRNAHCYWFVVRKGRCEARRSLRSRAPAAPQPRGIMDW